ncbi:hypothetical protein Ciccas_007427 [Cichlidogyrus casuarinus]|uniref:Protein RFT1 homolog n=1 Tax=Cichlidogyrus casuarinus TaxID=1844966 RepID=A0ABD2Q2X0_9PLAT
MLYESLESFHKHHLRESCSFLSTVEIEETYSRKIVGLFGMIFNGFCKLFLLAFTEGVNFIFLKKILQQVSICNDSRPSYGGLRKNKTPTDAAGNDKRGAGLPLVLHHFKLSPSVESAVGGLVVERIYVMIFYSIYDMEWRILLRVFATGSLCSTTLYAFSQSLLYSCYAFEYLWREQSGSLQAFRLT